VYKARVEVITKLKTPIRALIGTAWLSSVRVVKRNIKLSNERNP